MGLVRNKQNFWLAQYSGLVGCCLVSGLLLFVVSSSALAVETASAELQKTQKIERGDIVLNQAHLLADASSAHAATSGGLEIAKESVMLREDGSRVEAGIASKAASSAVAEPVAKNSGWLMVFMGALMLIWGVQRQSNDDGLL